ncbi:MAG: acyl carrier protein [Microcystis sp. M015S2]|jgi:acyl carrier protein|uniref:acyl carrier protein n=1 Tax=unclassified Microcystis TaxID=2643300 RepID=UPI0022CAD66B|nr:MULTISPECIES: phosphopantetheine-binding protein [unclassified Microcystis]MCZ8306429.1 phosphopantetheine-binding protein [Microcystis sp. LE19-98.1E]MCA2693158.1 acyl carrier protein [Microcystis sp. M034S2]MCA2711300.1 acyl carrier protein [Microcystis sp. M025S2]MCA2743597.1 acyl carrier protein [Microcystis sp. M015S2]MCA2751393.1 acyl carrier protein [Microcystis sp. M144S2]
MKDILSILADMGIEIDLLEPDSVLGDNLGMDSQEIVELHCNIEDFFGIDLPMNSINKNHSLKDLNQLVQQSVGVAV